MYIYIYIYVGMTMDDEWYFVLKLISKLKLLENGDFNI